MGEATAVANANVALAKYWGKRDEVLNLPYTGSISITLSGLESTAHVRFSPALDRDRIVLGEREAGTPEAPRYNAFLDLVRRMANHRMAAEVRLLANFPVAAGLASSASSFAALALAASCAAGLALTPRELSILARRGSGSACRSLFGGYAEWMAGESSDGSDSFAVELLPPEHWRLGVVIAVTDPSPKPVGSREGMAQAVKRSPFFPAWLESHEDDLDAVRHGIRTRDLQLVGRVAEHNCLKMHAVSLAAQPSVLYWKPATLAVMERVLRLRGDGVEAYFTVDAGPQVKVLCALAHRAAVAAAIGTVPGVRQVLLSDPGPAPRLVEAA